MRGAVSSSAPRERPSPSDRTRSRNYQPAADGVFQRCAFPRCTGYYGLARVWTRDVWFQGRRLPGMVRSIGGREFLLVYLDDK